MKKSKLVLLATLLSLTLIPSAKSETISIYDENFSVSGLPVGATVLGVRWGIWDSINLVFNQQVTANNNGYVDLTVSPREFSVALNQINNTIYAENTPMAIAIYAGTGDVSSSQFNTGFAARAVLTDASWITPLFANNANMIEFAFSANTTAVVGSFAFNAGNEVITLIPEPTSASLLFAGLAGLWVTARKRRKEFPMQKRFSIILNTKMSMPFVATFYLGVSSLTIFGQSTVSTPIVGFQSVSIPVGLSAVGFPLLNADILKTSVSSLSGNSLTLSGESNVGAKLASGEPYYIEVYGGSLKGDRFEIDTFATISAANGSVVLNSSSSANTLDVGSIGSQLNGVTVALRKHITIEQIQSMSSAALVGNNSATVADQIQLFDGGSGNYSSYFLRGDGITWRLVGTTVSANKTPIPPGTGIFILKRSNPVTITATGEVRQNDFSAPYSVGLQLVAPPYPIETSPSGIGATSANGWTGNNSATAADQILVFNSGSGSYESYFLRGDGTTWRQVGTVTVVTSNNIASSAQAFFISRKTADNNNYLVNPITP